MVGRSDNVRRQFHLLITREPDGFGWQIRYDGHGTPVQRSRRAYPTHADAASWGEHALAEFLEHQAKLDG